MAESYGRCLCLVRGASDGMLELVEITGVGAKSIKFDGHPSDRVY